jgi:hypothetical protein
MENNGIKIKLFSALTKLLAEPSGIKMTTVWYLCLITDFRNS